jgi:hypothetical protein
MMTQGGHPAIVDGTRSGTESEARAHRRVDGKRCAGILRDA